MSGSIECFYGPDGAGKTTFVEELALEDPSLIVLHGTNIGAWAGRYPELVGERLIPERLPGPEDILDKIDVVTGVSRAIARYGRDVKVDGHPAHKTAINVAAGLITVGDMVAGTPMDRLLADSPLARRFEDLTGDDPKIMHTYVDLPLSLSSPAAALELQRRIHGREGGPSRWDPQTAEQSAAQMDAAWALTIQFLNKGYLLDTVRPPIVQ